MINNFSISGKKWIYKKFDSTYVNFLKENLIDENYLPAIEKLMVDWVLYENGWHVLYNDGYKNEHLFYYLTQMHGYSGYRPEELEYFKQ